MKREQAVKIADIIIEYCLYGLLFFIPISGAGVEIFAAIANSFFIIKKILLPDFRFIKKNPYIYLSLAIFILFMAASLFNSGKYFQIGLRTLFSRWIQYIFIFICAADTFTNRRRIRNAIVVILFSTALSALSGLSQKFIGWEFLRGREMGGSKGRLLRATAGYRHQNPFASYLVLFIPLALVLNLIKVKKKIYKLGLIFWITLLISALLFTYSRGGWLGFLFGVGLLAFLLRRKKIVLTLIAVFLLILLFVPTVRERVSFTFSKKGDSSRFVIWQAGFEMIKENPFLGKGLKTFMLYYQQYAKRVNPFHKQPSLHAHNSYIQIWAETGTFSLLSFLVFVGLFFYNGIKIMKKNYPQTLSLLLAGILSGIFGYLVHCFFGAHLNFVQTSAPFWLMVGIAQALTIGLSGLGKEKTAVTDETIA